MQFAHTSFSHLGVFELRIPLFSKNLTLSTLMVSGCWLRFFVKHISKNEGKLLLNRSSEFQILKEITPMNIYNPPGIKAQTTYLFFLSLGLYRTLSSITFTVMWQRLSWMLDIALTPTPGRFEYPTRNSRSDGLFSGANLLLVLRRVYS